MSVRRALLPLAAAAALALSGCGSADPAPATPGSTVAPSTLAPSTVTPSTLAPSTVAGSTSAAEPSLDSSGAGGSVATSRSADRSRPTLVDEADAQAATMTLTNGAFTPGTVTVKARSTVTFAVGDADLHGIVVGEQASVTSSRTVPNIYFFADPGHYAISDEMTGATATVVVE